MNFRNRKLNKWYDHGLGEGESPIDLPIFYNDYSVEEFLETLYYSFSFHRPVQAVSYTEFEEAETRIITVKEKPLTSFILLRYLNQSRILNELANSFV